MSDSSRQSAANQVSSDPSITDQWAPKRVILSEPVAMRISDREKRPANPQMGDIHIGSNSRRYLFNGKKWQKLCSRDGCMRLNRGGSDVCLGHLGKPLLDSQTPFRSATDGHNSPKQQNIERKRRVIKAVDVNDVLEELSEENRRLLNELLFTNELMNLFDNYKTFIDSISAKFKLNLDSNEFKNFEELTQRIEDVMNRKTIRINILINRGEESEEQMNVMDSPLDQIIDERDISPEYTPTVPTKKIMKTQKVSAKGETTTRKPIKKSFDCHYCGTRIVRYDRLVQHIRRAHPEVDVDKNYYKYLGKNTCAFEGCGQNFTSKINLDNHMESEHGVDRSHVCGHPGCDYKTAHITYLKSHQLTHLLRSVPIIKCTVIGCRFATNSLDTLKIHELNHIEPRERRFVCGQCQHTFASFGTLNTHLKNTHSKQRLQCTHEGCPKKFKNKNALNFHVKSAHSDSTRQHCDWPGCDYWTASGNHLKRHQLRHTERQPLVCDVDGCGKKLVNKDSLKKHKDHVHQMGPKLSCDWPGCEYTTYNKTALYLHRRVHKTGGFECPWPGCGKRINSKKSLEEHINGVHKKVKPYVCPVAGCEYRGSFNKSIPQHLKHFHKQK